MNTNSLGEAGRKVDDQKEAHFQKLRAVGFANSSEKLTYLKG